MKHNYYKILEKLCLKECDYYTNNIDLIAASNFVRPELVSVDFYKVQRSMEGLLLKRPYAGTKYLDEIENVGVEAAKRLFNAEVVNIQPHSGSQANQAAYMALLNPGEKILSMKFDAGGHLTHGCPINFSGKFYKFDYYGINSKTQLLDYDELEIKAKRFMPRLIVAGASSYPRKIDYRKIGQIAESVNAFFMADIAHPIGLIAAGLYPSPVDYADIVTSSTEKTLWGPHGGLIMGKKKFKDKINRAVHPGTQSSVPISRLIQISMALLFAETEKFKDYAEKVVENAKVLEKKFIEIPNCLLFGGTDSHFIVIDVGSAFNLSGKKAEQILEKCGIFTNRQVVPWEKRNCYETSGLRIGSPSATAMGYIKQDFELLADIIIKILQNPDNHIFQNKMKAKVRNIIYNRKTYEDYKFKL